MPAVVDYVSSITWIRHHGVPMPWEIVFVSTTYPFAMFKVFLDTKNMLFTHHDLIQNAKIDNFMTMPEENATTCSYENMNTFLSDVFCNDKLTTEDGHEVIVGALDYDTFHFLAPVFPHVAKLTFPEKSKSELLATSAAMSMFEKQRRSE